MTDFVHLHCHTQYSLLDGANRPKDICRQAKEWGSPALAITDHGNMFGAIDFYTECKKNEIKPIIGMEAYVAREKGIHNHLILLCKNLQGYKNLMKLSSSGYTEGFYYKPRIDKEILAGFSEGLIGLSACIKGEIPQLILNGREEEAMLIALEYRRIFHGDFFLELQVNGIPNQDVINAGLMRMGKKLNIPLVATSDCHYFRREDARAHEVLLCLQTAKTISDPKRMRFTTDEFWFKSPDEMAAQFHFCPEAIQNTLMVAEKCNLELEFGHYHLPTYPVPEGYTAKSYFEHVARAGLEKRLSSMNVNCKAYTDRLEYEIAIIERMGFPGYMLLVWDFINHARSEGIPVGPGRGSVAGSTVAWAMNITEVDPIPYGLLFERFLNPDRISMPDIDMDFCQARREEMLDYARSKYGADKVSQIITFGTMGARAAIRDVARVLEMPFSDGDAMAKLIPDELYITLDKAMEQSPEFKKLVESSAETKEVFRIAKALEGLTRHASKHAAGVVMAQTPMTDWAPLYKDSDGTVCIQYDMNCAEKIGLVKFDFLGIKTLDVIDGAIKAIRTSGREIDILNIPIDDRQTFDLIRSGKTLGVFQFESEGMIEKMIELQPDRFEDLIAMAALYRPGPLSTGMTAEYISRKHGRSPVEYDFPELEPLLKETYGISPYQEQISQIAVVLAGYTMAQADILRKAMGKKKPEEMAKQRENFVKGAVAKGHNKQKVVELFEKIEKFASYAFNKSHSTAYALIAYQTAYLKTHYAPEFMAALLTTERSDTEGIVKYIADCKAIGVKTLPPDVNRSNIEFTTDNGSVRFGLSAVRNVGETAVQSIISARAEGDFKSLFDFCRRVNLKKVNKKVIESLIGCGAFDSTGYSRSQNAAALERAMLGGKKVAKDEATEQSSFEFETRQGDNSLADKYPDVPEWLETEILMKEKEMLGFYLSGHPLDRLADEISLCATHSLAGLKELHNEDYATVVALIVSRKDTITKKGDLMAIIKIEDPYGEQTALVFPKIYRKYKEHLVLGSPLVITGKVSVRPQDTSFVVDTVRPLSDMGDKTIKKVEITIGKTNPDPESLIRLLVLLREHAGKVPVFLKRSVPAMDGATVYLDVKKDKVTGKPLAVRPTDELRTAVERIYGSGALVYL